MTDIELAWAAGLFEGEGTVRINKPTKRNMGAVIVSVVNTDRQVLDFFQARWPGCMKPLAALSPRHKPAWLWVRAALDAAAFLRAIRPFVVRDRVKERIDHALDYQAGKSKSTRVNRSYEYAEAQWVGYWWMCELNQRGVQPDA